jgi:hypothetical protein
VVAGVRARVLRETEGPADNGHAQPASVVPHGYFITIFTHHPRRTLLGPQVSALALSSLTAAEVLYSAW